MRNKIFTCALLLAVLLAGPAYAEVLAGPGIAVADVEGGKLQGYIRNGIYTYHGVQYAQAEPFMPPVKVPAWEGVKPALMYGPMSPQGTSRAEDMFPSHWYWPYWPPRSYEQDNNCQNLNIWTPGLDGKKRPVMVWLHGGGFMAGSAMAEDVYDGENLSRTGDVVVVSVNHRLNVLGFLDLSAYGEEYRYSGNVGLMDIVAALEWVKANIATFGGDPDNVTLFGQSGGGAKILTLMATPAAKGLFHKAIEESGAVELMGITLPGKTAARRVAELTLQNLGLKDPSGLKSVAYPELIRAADRAMELTIKEGYAIFSWSPVKDGDYIPADPVEGGFPEQAKDIPLMIGSTLNEWISVPLFAEMERTQTDNKNYWDDSRVWQELRAKYGDKADAIASAFLKAYPYKNRSDVLYIDTWLRSRAKKTMNIKSDQKGAPVYAYVFTWETPIMGGYAMAYHCSELPFVFNNIALSETATGGGKDAQALADVVSRAWVDFARTGNPGWEAYTRDNGATMLFDNDSIITYHHDDELMKLLLPDYEY